MDISRIKSVSPNRVLFKKIIAFVFSVVVMVVSFIIISDANKKARDTVDVIRVKSQTGLQAYEVLTINNIERYSIISKEYTEDMLLAEEMPEIINKMAKYYIRKNSILYKDQVVDEKPIKNEWLYELDDEHEVVTIPYNYLECGGDVLLPGDRIRIRVTYEVEDTSASYAETEEYNPNLYTDRTKGEKTITVILFDSIVVMDILNSNSHSIYEIYKEVMKLSEDKRQEVMKSDEFLKSIQPRALLLAGTKEQIDNYAKYYGNNAKSILITILSRAKSNVILDQLPTLKNEVESWIEKEKK